VCGINDPRHTYDEYMVLLAKSGMAFGEVSGSVVHGRVVCCTHEPQGAKGTDYQKP
jgi:hypothetical protein